MVGDFLTSVVEHLQQCQNNVAIVASDDMLRRVGQVHFQKGVNFTADNYLVFKRLLAANINEQMADKTPNK